VLFHCTCTARQYMHCHTEQRECDADTLRQKERFFDRQARRRINVSVLPHETVARFHVLVVPWVVLKSRRDVHDSFHGVTQHSHDPKLMTDEPRELIYGMTIASSPDSLHCTTVERQNYRALDFIYL
jgi:hypothetical protein